MRPLSRPARTDALAALQRDWYEPADAAQILEFLQAAGTFDFPQLPSGLFSAAVATHADFAATGYHHVWVRDNVHVAWAHWCSGRKEAAVRCHAGLMRHFHQQRPRIERILQGQADANDPMQRPHIRFRGDLTESPEIWSHAQNDALGAFVWLTTQLMAAGGVTASPEDWDLIESLCRYFEHITYWNDEDSGHWEEVRKVAASSIGCVVAGLTGLWELLHHPTARQRVDAARVTRLLSRGRAALAEILPYECRQPNPLQQRRYDAALLFLIEPLHVVHESMATTIVSDVTRQLLGPHGVRRYLGDSYWCADYKELMSAERRTSDFSDNLSERDRLLQPGGEAQWCLFDPILAHIALGELRRSLVGTAEHRAAGQRLSLHLNRSLRQLTGEDSPFGPYRCPESYYQSRAAYVPNDMTPLLWTQANLLRVLWNIAHPFA